LIYDQFAEAKAIREFTWMPQLAYRAATASGDGWAMLPSAAAFIDPLFSTGFPLTLLGIERLGRALEEGRFNQVETMNEYNEFTLAEADHTAQFIAGCYSGFPQFQDFAAYSMFYFVAASFSEMARRLGRGHMIRRFLASDHPAFGRAARDLGRMLRTRSAQSELFAEEVRKQTDCLNIAGLCNPTKRNWYGVDFEDLVAVAAKLAMTPAEVREVLRHADWAHGNRLAAAVAE
jgi:FADH2 O2-dependent halogenase